MATDHEHRLLEILSRQEAPSQRQVAKQSGLSLGMVNLVLKRMVKTGYIKVSLLNGKTVRYVLTPKGTAELAKRSYEYLLHVISSFGDLRSEIAGLVSDLHYQGKRRFLIYGQSDVADLAELACRGSSLDGLRVFRQVDGQVKLSADLAVLDCRIDVAPEDRVGLDVLEELARAKEPDKRNTG